MKTISIKEAIAFALTLPERYEGQWQDDEGAYKIVIGEDILWQELSKLPVVAVVSDLNYSLPGCLTFAIPLTGSSYVVSIGSYESHNTARLRCEVLGSRLVTVPVPLANDSFCTNRVLRPGEEKHSSAGIYPSLTIIDLALLRKVPMKANLLGVGEFAGLYCSIIDYFLSRGCHLPEDELVRIGITLRDLVYYSAGEPDEFNAKLAAALIMKGLVMRVNGDHQVGCGIDHLLGYVIETKTKLPHGLAVYWGFLITMALFPEWETHGITLEDLFSYGRGIGYISTDILKQVTVIDEAKLVAEAVESRPHRPTMLQTKCGRVNNLWETLNYHMQ